MSDGEPPSRYMARALDLARSVLGTTRPNPAVGAVLVRHGEIIAEGATQPPGGPHAEVVALRTAGDQARGATLYVTLEPCSVHGRTPPCTEALITAGVAEVVVACLDPDPRVDGSGLQHLRTAGLTVRSGDGAPAARRHYEAYAHHRRTGRPYVIVKYAASLDGKIAATSGDSRWVSGPQSREWAQRLRPTLDAILVGVETVRSDDPRLTARPAGRPRALPQPLRVVLDSRGRTPVTARVVQEQDLAPTLIATTAAASADWCARLRAIGVQIRTLPPDAEGRVALPPLLDLLAQEYGVLSLLVEGGGQVTGAFFDQRLVNKVHAIIAPLIIGGNAAQAVAGRGAARLTDAFRLREVSVERLGPDMLITGYPVPPLPLADVTVRPGAAEEVAALLAAAGDLRERDLLAAVLGDARPALDRGEGGAWLARHADQPVGALVLCYPAHRGREARQAVATVRLVYVQPDWREQGLAARLLDAAEASAAGRGARWLTVTVPGPADASGWSREDWRRRGYRYHRRAAEGAVELIVDVADGDA